MPNSIIRSVLFLMVLFSFEGIAQDANAEVIEDTKYREDQFYVGATYNLLSNVPSGVNIRGLSGGFQFGYLRDMPINEQRNIAIAIGAGFAYDVHGQNLFIGETEDEKTIFSVLSDEIDFSRNSFSTSALEIPIEFRWRSSTARSYRFWRVYGGLRAGYVYWYKATFKGTENNVNQTDIPEFNKLRLGATMSFGYNTFNFFVYYGINPFFKDAFTSEMEPVKFRTIKVGLLFYIL